MSQPGPPRSAGPDAAPPGDARWVRVDTARLRRWIDNFADRHGELSSSADETWVSLSAADGTRAWIEIPFAPMDLSQGRLLTTLCVHAARERTVGVLLVRRGGHAAGVFRGRSLTSSKVGSAYVQGTTKAGGWSQQRYARRRDNQARAAFAEAGEVAVRVLVPELSTLEAVYLGGDRAACTAALDDFRLAGVSALVREPFLSVADPRLKVLQATPELFCTVRVAIHP